ncbi:hypothetical protein MKZ38_005951 [Zalerion maritima]|uniref:Uncharacterized protein n=1 Tax=Zalerion maritima TaxID=339359 RepID=A0AAD5RWQ7_9PEZI|nr:hypothetical protein MKZ38_005951 [Zalerion maritima]
MTSKPNLGRSSSHSDAVSSQHSSSLNSGRLSHPDHSTLHVSFSPSCSSLSSKANDSSLKGGAGVAAAAEPSSSSLQDRQTRSSQDKILHAPELHNYETYTCDLRACQDHHQLPRIASSSTTSHRRPGNGPIDSIAAYNKNNIGTITAGPYSAISASDLHQSLALLSLHDPYRLGHSHLEEPDSMDEAFRQHANPSRRKNLSTSHLDHLSLAPLSSRLPFLDSDDQFDGDNGSGHSYITTSRSYIEGKSAPTTPGIFGGRRNSTQHPRAHLHPPAATAASMPKKSLSATTLQGMMGGSGSGQPIPKHRRSGSGSHTPTRHNHHRLAMTATADTTAASSTADRDWLEHTGALLSDSAREYKGQSWLVSRDSSTSLTGQGRERSSEQEGGSWTIDPAAQSRRSSASVSRVNSRAHSRSGSRAASRMGSRVATPMEKVGFDVGYFTSADSHDDPSQEDLAGDGSEWAEGPNFVNLDESLEASMVGHSVNTEEDEAAIRSLVRNGNGGMGGWIGGIVGWPLFSVDEEESTEEGAMVEDSELSRTGSTVWLGETVVGGRRSGGGVSPVVEEPIPPPLKDDGGGWHDAAWLLSVASKVLM